MSNLFEETRSAGSIASARALRLVLLGTAVFLLFAASPALGDNPAQGVLLATQDAYVFEENSGTNYGNGPHLFVGPALEFGYHERIFIAFDPAWLPEDAVIQTAEMNLYMYHLSGDGGSQGLHLRTVNEDWLEWSGSSAINWDNQPSCTPFDYQEIAPETGWKTFDVTDLVAGWVEGSLPNYGVMLTASASAEGLWSRGFYSREAPLCVPHIRVTYTTEGVPPESPELPACSPHTDETAPEIEMWADPNPARAGDTFQVHVEVTDDVGLYRVQIMEGNNLVADEVVPAGQTSFSMNPLEISDPGMVRYSAMAWDLQMNGKSASLRIPVLEDGEPPIVRVSHEPLNPSAGDTVTFTVEAEDPSEVDAIAIFVNNIPHDFILPHPERNPMISMEYETSADARVVRYWAYATDQEGFYTSTGTKFVILDNSGHDTDGDHLSDAVEEALGLDSSGNDTDFDGLYDHWEVLGVDADDDGTIDLDLPGMGANPHQKDVFVEVDWMEDGSHSHRLHPTAAQALVNAYRDYSVRLHVDLGQLGGGNAFPHVDSIEGCDSTCENCTVAEWDAIEAIKADNFDPVRRGIFYYVTVLHHKCNGPKTHCRGDICSGEIILASSDPGGSVGNTETVARQTTFFFHELGHAMGLGHGGQMERDTPRTVRTLGPEGDIISVDIDWQRDDENGKPNYLSNMNYRYQWYLRFLPEGGDPDPDSGDSIYVYSYSLLDSTLNENMLYESMGLNSTGVLGTYVWRRGKDVHTEYELFHESMRGAFYIWLYENHLCPPYELDWWLADGSWVDWDLDGVPAGAPYAYDTNSRCRTDDFGVCNCTENLSSELVSPREIGLLRTKIYGAADQDINFGIEGLSLAALDPDGTCEEESVASGPDEDSPMPPLRHDAEYCDGMDNDGDGLIDEGFPDQDEDGIADPVDNCPFDYNRSQMDSDRDGIGNACDYLPGPPSDLTVVQTKGLWLTWNPSGVDDVIGHNVYRKAPGETGLTRLGPAYPTTLASAYPIECEDGTVYAVSGVDIFMQESPLSQRVLLKETGFPQVPCIATPMAPDPVTCNDGNACTTDAPDPKTGGCTHTLKDCDDGIFCNGEETCNPVNGECLSPGTPCPDDGLFCNGEEGCEEEGDKCYHTGDPCTGPDEECDEEQDTCEDLSQLELVKPSNGTTLSKAPTLVWLPGKYDVFRVYLIFSFRGNYTGFWTGWIADTSLDLSAFEPLWTSVDRGSWGGWVVLGVDMDTYTWDLEGPWWFRKAP